MSDDEHARAGAGGRLLAAAGLLAILLTGCSGRDTVEVSTAGPPRAPVTTVDENVSTFQGPVASLDVARGEFVVAVAIVWTPVIDAEPHERRVVVGADTRWPPGAAGVAALRVGEELQVQAEGGADGAWRARRIELFDLD